jgi:hypothetical protein
MVDLGLVKQGNWYQGQAILYMGFEVWLTLDSRRVDPKVNSTSQQNKGWYISLRKKINFKVLENDHSLYFIMIESYVI